MSPDAGQAALAAASAGLASFVEFVEALTVILAVGATRGWPTALAGAAGGLALLTALVAMAGPALSGLHLAWLRLPVGVLVLLFGLRWLRKAILRASGHIKLHDEDEAYRRATARSAAGPGPGQGAGDPQPGQSAGPRRGGLDWGGFATVLQVVLMEGSEVAFIVVAVAAGGAGLLPAASGAGLALLAVACLGAVLHRPLSRVPENTLKAAVGVLLTAFGTAWTGEGIGGAGPGGDAGLVLVTLGWAVVGRLLVRTAARCKGLGAPGTEAWLAGLGWVGLCAVAGRFGLQPVWTALLLLPGLTVALAASVLRKAAGPV